jgi:hypothetical protein
MVIHPFFWKLATSQSRVSPKGQISPSRSLTLFNDSFSPSALHSIHSNDNHDLRRWLHTLWLLRQPIPHFQTNYRGPMWCCNGYLCCLSTSIPLKSTQNRTFASIVPDSAVRRRFSPETVLRGVINMDTSLCRDLVENHFLAPGLPRPTYVVPTSAILGESAPCSRRNFRSDHLMSVTPSTLTFTLIRVWDTSNDCIPLGKNVQVFY